MPYLREKGVGVMNAGPFSARLLTNAPLPAWLKEPENVKAAARKAAEHCASKGVDIAKVEPFTGDILLGEEEWEECDENWQAKVKETPVTKSDLDAIAARLETLETAQAKPEAA